MAKKVRKLLAGALALVTCFPLAACGTGVSVYDEGTVDPSAYESTTAGADQTVSDGSDPVAVDTPTGADATADDAGDAVAESEWISWLALIWADGSAVAAPSTYVRTENPDGTLSVEISDANALAYFSHDVYANADDFVGAEVKLTADIDLRNELWIPIGMDTRDNPALDHSFRGRFDGNNHKISGLNGTVFAKSIVSESDILYSKINDDVKFAIPVDGSKQFVYGLFGAVADAEIKNITVTDFTLDMTADGIISGIRADCVGAVVGLASGSLTVDNCVAGTAKTENVEVKKVRVAGGIVGRSYNYKAKDGGSYAWVDAETSTVCDLTVSNCTNYLNIGTETDERQKGGILGFASYCSKVSFTACINYGDIKGEYVGGITSFIQQSPVIDLVKFDKCENHGEIFASDRFAGGIIGCIESPKRELVLTDCVNYGNVTDMVRENLSTAFHSAAGIAGYVSVNLAKELWSRDEALGGVGYNKKTDGIVTQVTVDGLYNYGTITGAKKPDNTSKYSYAGGIFGCLSLSQDQKTSSDYVTALAQYEKGEIDVLPEYPYPDVVFGTVVNCGKVTCPDGYYGTKRQYVGGIIGVIASGLGPRYNLARVKVSTFVNTYGAVKEVDYSGNISHDNRNEGV